MSTVQKQQEDVEDHITQRFELVEIKGKGAYGVVWKAIDKKSKKVVALKKIFDAFHNSTDSQRTFREVIILEQLRSHENIIKLIEVIKSDNNKDLYMVFDFMETDLHKVIRANILEPVHKKYVIYQLLKALKFLHSGDLIHRDLKPANLLINAECHLKLADFGLARTINQLCEEPVLTEYVATRWYRAPEILLGSQQYSKAVDMWSIGCILGEMITGKAMFPGTSTMNQVELIIEMLGKPTSEDIESLQAPLANHIVQNISQSKQKQLNTIFKSIPQDVYDFIKNLLVLNPNKRITAEQALAHPYMQEFAGSEDEPVIKKKIQTYMNDNIKYSTTEYRNTLYKHIFQKESPKLSKSNSIVMNQPLQQKKIENIENQKSKGVLSPQHEKLLKHYKSIEQMVNLQKSKQKIDTVKMKPINKSVSLIRNNSGLRVNQQLNKSIKSKDKSQMEMNNIKPRQNINQKGMFNGYQLEGKAQLVVGQILKNQKQNKTSVENQKQNKTALDQSKKQKKSSNNSLIQKNLQMLLGLKQQLK